jgi:hypothetical protein
MALTLKQQMTADVSAVFLDTDEHAEAVIHYPAGNLAAPATVNAVVDRDSESSSGLAGDGSQIDTRAAVKIRRSAVLEMSASVTVTETSGSHQASPSLFEFDGHRWRAVRVLERDDDLQLVLVTRLDKIATRTLERS